MRRFIRCIASVAVAAGIIFGSLLPAVPASAASNDTTYWFDLDTTKCSNCENEYYFPTWSTAFPAPYPLAIIQKLDCTTSPDWSQSSSDRFSSGGVWYVAMELWVHNTINCPGADLKWRLTVVNGS
jgi:hypothetical protein